MINNMKLFGEMLQKRRKARGWTLKDLEEKSGVVYSYISKIERGLLGSRGISQEMMRRLAEPLDIDINRFDRKENEFDILKELWSSKLMVLDGEVIELTDEAAHRIETAIRMGFAWAKDLNEGKSP